MLYAPSSDSNSSEALPFLFKGTAPAPSTYSLDHTCRDITCIDFQLNDLNRLLPSPQIWVRSKLEALLAALEIRAASQVDANFLRGYISSSATMTFVVCSMLCCAIWQCATFWCKICLLLSHQTCQCRPASCKTEYYLNTLCVLYNIYVLFWHLHLIVAVLECIAGLLFNWTVHANSYRVYYVSVLFHCRDTSMASDSRAWARANH
jgi:hypothetical protein